MRDDDLRRKVHSRDAPAARTDDWSATSTAPASFQAEDPYVGTVFEGRYEIEEKIGIGGMGVVYRARHTMIGKKFAIKVLRKDKAYDRESTNRFLLEAKAASSIGNPHIVDISDFGALPDGAMYFVMEFLDGTSLRELLEKEGALAPPRIFHIGKQLAQGLAAAHAAGIIHRDLKPDNIMLVPRGTEPEFVKILDFGVAKVGVETSTITRAGTVFGTPHYVSPEQAVGMKVDIRTDIYAMGVILYQMAAGRVPFDADNFMAVLTQHIYKQPESLRTLVPPPRYEISPHFDAMVLKCLSKHADSRYANVEELFEDLERLDTGMAPAAFQAASRPNMQVFDSSEMRVFAALVVGACVSAALLGFAMRRPREVFLAQAHTHAPVLDTSRPSANARPLPAPPAKHAVLLAIEPSDAKVTRGTTDLGGGPYTIDVAPGETIELRARRAGYRDEIVRINDASEPKRIVKMALLPAPPAATGARAASHGPKCDITEPGCDPFK